MKLEKIEQSNPNNKSLLISDQKVLCFGGAMVKIL